MLEFGQTLWDYWFHWLSAQVQWQTLIRCPCMRPKLYSRITCSATLFWILFKFGEIISSIPRPIFKDAAKLHISLSICMQILNYLLISSFTKRSQSMIQLRLLISSVPSSHLEIEPTHSCSYILNFSNT